MFDNLNSIKEFKVYQYTFLDDLSFTKSPEEVYKSFKRNDEQYSLDDYVDEIKNLFKNNGWEGDGEIEIIWLPPFIDFGQEDTLGNYLWHVKQQNNGISFVTSRYDLNFKRLNIQNDNCGSQNHISANIICDITLGYLSRLKTDKEAFITNYPENEYLEKRILYFTQNELVNNFFTYLEDCYHNVLVEVLQNGNKSRIMLQKTNSKIDLFQHDFSEYVSDSNYFTITSIVMDILNSYKFESSDEKLSKLFKGLEFKIDPETNDFIKKHIVIRNCIQHHDCELNAFMLKKYGKESISIKSNGGNLVFKKWAEILLTKEEVSDLFDSLFKTVISFNAHVDKRVQTRVWIEKDRYHTLLNRK